MNLREEREQRGMPSINSLWISGIGKLNDVKAPRVIQESKHLYGSHPLLAGLAKLYNIPHSEVLNITAAGSFAWLENPELVWPILSVALSDEELDEVLIIDFPKGKARERIFRSKDLSKKSWAFWKKVEPLTWKEIISS